VVKARRLSLAIAASALALSAACSIDNRTVSVSDAGVSLTLLAGSLEPSPFMGDLKNHPLYFDDSQRNLYLVARGSIYQVAIDTGDATFVAGSPDDPSVLGTVGDLTAHLVQVGDPADANAVVDFLYLADPSACVIRRVEVATGHIGVVAGGEGSCFSQDDQGGGVEGAFSHPSVIMLCGGWLIVSEDRAIRRVNLESNEVTTLATTPNHLAFLTCNETPQMKFDVYGSTMDGSVYRIPDIDQVSSTAVEYRTLPGIEIDHPVTWKDLNLSPPSLFVPTAHGLWRVGLDQTPAEEVLSWSFDTGLFIPPSTLVCPGSGAQVLTGTGAGYVAIDDCSGRLQLAVPGEAAELDVMLKAAPNDGPPTTAVFARPFAITTAPSGDVFVTDQHSIRRIVAGSHEVETLPEKIPLNFGGNLWPGESAIVSDLEGHLYVAQPGSAQIVRVDANTGVTSMFVGPDPDETLGYLGPGSLAIDNKGSGTLYAGDSRAHTISAIDIKTKKRTLVAGTIAPPPPPSPPTPPWGPFDSAVPMPSDGASSQPPSDAADAGAYGDAESPDATEDRDGDGDGDADSALDEDGDAALGDVTPAATPDFVFPIGLALVGRRLFVADAGLSAIKVVDLDTKAISVFAGTLDAAGTADGVGQYARFLRPVAIVSDGKDTLYVADQGAGTIRKIVVSTAQVTTIVGAVHDENDDYWRSDALWSTQLAPAPGHLYQPRGLALGRNGELYITVPNGIVEARP
jgi:hypothetical protein